MIEINNKKRLTELDILRGIAALCVSLIHLGGLTKGLPFSATVFDFGITMPSLFFIISGFVIFMTVEKIKTWQEFIITRFFRLYPSFWISLILSLFFIYLAKNEAFPTIKEIIANVTMAPFLFRQPVIVVSFWTLLIEMEFYLFIIMIFCFKLIPKINLVIIVALILDCILHKSNFRYERLFIIITGIIPFFSQAHFFFAGIIFYKLKMNPTERKIYLNYFILLFCLLFTFVMHGLGGRVYYYFSIWQELLFNTAFFGIFLLFSFDMLKLPNFKLLKLLGIISYNYYLLHEKLGYYVIKVLSKTGLNSIVILMVTLTSIAVISYIICFYVELPLVRYSKKRFIKG